MSDEMRTQNKFQPYVAETTRLEMFVKQMRQSRLLEFSISDTN